MDTELEHWIEWKERCNLRLCSQETQESLLNYAGKRAQSLIRRAMSSLKSKWQDLHEIDRNPWLIWDEYDAYYWPNKLVRGMPYKDWVFFINPDTTRDRVDVLERRSELLLRNVVRHYINKNYPRKLCSSIDAPLPGAADQARTLHDVLPSPDASFFEQIADRDEEGLAQQIAAHFFDDLCFRERVVMAASGLGLPASCPEVEEAAQSKKSMLSAARKEAGKRLKDYLSRNYSEEGDHLRFMTVKALLDKCVNWAETQEKCDALFRLRSVRDVPKERQE